jgi:hypothetical protein
MGAVASRVSVRRVRREVDGAWKGTSGEVAEIERGQRWKLRGRREQERFGKAGQHDFLGFGAFIPAYCDSGLIYRVMSLYICPSLTRLISKGSRDSRWMRPGSALRLK